MSINIVVPPLGESVSEAVIAKWHKKSGDAVKVDEIILELETDKVTLEVNAPANGVLSELKFAEGDSVSVGALLAIMQEGAASSVAPAASAVPAAPVLQSAANNAQAMHSQSSVIASPAANKIAYEKGIDLSSINASGKDGRVTKADVLNPQDKPSASTAAKTSEIREQRVRMTKLRKTIADRLKESQNTAAILTTFNEVDMSKVFELRKKYQDLFTKEHDVKLGFMSFFVRAVVAALKKVPAVNARIEGDDIVYNNYYDLGIAVGTDKGLVVPVLRDADTLSFANVEKGIAQLGSKARKGELSINDMSGATFTITNGGIYGSMLSTPIINPPQSGILGMHNIVERPVAINGEVKIRPIMYIALSYDHRIIDGKEAVTFLVVIKDLIENPDKLLFDL